MTQFDLYMANLPYHEDSHILRGPHPVVIVSNDVTNANSPLITVVPLTSRLRRFDLPTHIPLSGQGLWKDSMAICEQVMPLDSSRCMRQLGHIDCFDDQAALIRGIEAHLGLA